MMAAQLLHSLGSPSVMAREVRSKRRSTMKTLGSERCARITSPDLEDVAGLDLTDLDLPLPNNLEKNPFSGVLREGGALRFRPEIVTCLRYESSIVGS